MCSDVAFARRGAGLQSGVERIVSMQGGCVEKKRRRRLLACACNVPSSSRSAARGDVQNCVKRVSIRGGGVRLCYAARSDAMLRTRGARQGRVSDVRAALRFDGIHEPARRVRRAAVGSEADVAWHFRSRRRGGGVHDDDFSRRVCARTTRLLENPKPSRLRISRELSNGASRSAPFAATAPE